MSAGRVSLVADNSAKLRELYEPRAHSRSGTAARKPAFAMSFNCVALAKFETSAAAEPNRVD